MPELPGYVLRIYRDDLEERRLLGRRVFYVGVRRDWTRGTKVLFVKKDMFISSGVIGGFAGTDEMEEPEKKMCLENNWYGRIALASLARFVPSVPVQGTPAAGLNPLALHGATMPGSDVLQIEKSAAARIIS